MLNRHLSKKHKAKGLFERFETLRDSLGGRPQCCHCHRKLASWRGLVTHIQLGHCSAFDLALAWQVAPADQEELRDYARKQAWQALVENLTLIQVIREQCILCGRFFANGKELLQHVHRMHQALWAASMHYTAEIMHFLRGLKACSACGKDVNVAHSCHAVRQMAILRVLVKSDITTAELKQVQSWWFRLLYLILIYHFQKLPNAGNSMAGSPKQSSSQVETLQMAPRHVLIVMLSFKITLD